MARGEHLADAEREELERFRDDPAMPPRQVLRARIVLEADSGSSNRETAAAIGTSIPTVALWRRRYAEGGIAALKDQPRPGRPRLTDSRTRASSAKRSRSKARRPPTRRDPPKQSAAEELNDATLERLLDAASKTISRRGFGATRVADIAKEASVSPATVHYYFKTKEEILIRTLLWANDRLVAQVEAASADSDDPIVDLARFIERTIPYSGMQRDEYLLEIDLWSRVRLHPELLPAWEDFSNRWISHVAELITAGIERGVFLTVAPADEIAERLAAMTDGLAAQAAIGSVRMPPERARAIVLRFVAEQLGVEIDELEKSAKLPHVPGPATA